MKGRQCEGMAYSAYAGHCTMTRYLLNSRWNLDGDKIFDEKMRVVNEMKVKIRVWQNSSKVFKRNNNWCLKIRMFPLKTFWPLCRIFIVYIRNKHVASAVGIFPIISFTDGWNKIMETLVLFFVLRKCVHLYT